MSNGRRHFLSHALTILLAPATVLAASPDARPKAVNPESITPEEWMAEWTRIRGLSGALELSRFVEPIWFLKSPISWRPDAGRTGFGIVQAPAGFVTDLASIPRVFFVFLRPDGEYAYAAIIHDFLYWEQPVPRKTADDILRMAMEDLEVSPATVSVIYNAVRLFGEASWKSNAEAKAQGEKRILRRFPAQPTVRWRDWKKLPGVLA
jgi:hypothetical protein